MQEPRLPASQSKAYTFVSVSSVSLMVVIYASEAWSQATNKEILCSNKTAFYRH